MDEKLERLARRLRSETCPQRVLDEVERRISRNAPLRLQFKIAVGIVAAVALLVLWCWPGDRNSHQASPGSPVAVDSSQAAQQAKVALGCVGAALRDAGVRSEEVILKKAVPPLRNSLQTARNKIWNHT